MSAVAGAVLLLGCDDRDEDKKRLIVVEDQAEARASRAGGPVQHALTIVRYKDEDGSSSEVALSATEADKILGEMGTILKRDDGNGDVSCDVTFVRDGPIDTFDDITDGYIYTKADYERVMALPGCVKVVKQINWCGKPKSAVYGCADQPGESMLVTRETVVSAREASLWLHEFGHNKGLNHRQQTGTVMYEHLLGDNWRVKQGECKKYRKAHTCEKGTE